MDRQDKEKITDRYIKRCCLVCDGCHKALVGCSDEDVIRQAEDRRWGVINGKVYCYRCYVVEDLVNEQ